MYHLTINYLDGSTTVVSLETFEQIKQRINDIDKLVDSIDMRYESDTLLEDVPDIDETSHLSWGI